MSDNSIYEGLYIVKRKNSSNLGVVCYPLFPESRALAPAPGGFRGAENLACDWAGVNVC